MSKAAVPRRGISGSSNHHHSSMPSDDLLYFAPTELAELNISSPYPASVPLTPSTQSMSQLSSLSAHSQNSQHSIFADMPVPTFEHGQYLTVNGQLPWSPDSLLVPSLHTDVSSQGSSPSEARLASESPSFQDVEGEAEVLTAGPEPKKPKRSRPNRYKNAPPAVIQRRRAANRKSQQAYRKRKDDRIAELEELLNQSTQREQEMGHAFMALRAEYEQLLMLGSPAGSHANGHHASAHVHGRSSSIASATTTTTTAATSEEEEAASTFMALATFAQGNGCHRNPIGLSPEVAHPQCPQQPTPSPHLFSVYPPPPM